MRIREARVQVLMTKNQKNCTAEKNLYCFLSKISIYLSPVLHKGVLSNRRIVRPQERHPALQNMKILYFLVFLIFVGNFSLLDLYAATQIMRSMRIRVRKPVVADLDPGSGAFLTPGSGIDFFQIPDSRPVFLKAW